MKNITIVADDNVGLLANISYILGAAHINIETLAASVQGGKCIVGITVKDIKRATELLQNNGYKVLESEMIVVKIKDEPTRMAEFTGLLLKEKISITAMYPLSKDGSHDTFAVKVDHPAKARKVLESYIVDCGQK